MIGLTKVDIERDVHRQTTTLKLEVQMTETNVLRKRHEMVAIGLVMILASDDGDLAAYIADKAKLDIEKYKAILALIGCTKEEVEKEDEEYSKDQFKDAIQQGKKRISAAPVGGISIAGPSPPARAPGEPCTRCGAIGLCLCRAAQ